MRWKMPSQIPPRLWAVNPVSCKMNGNKKAISFHYPRFHGIDSSDKYFQQPYQSPIRRVIVVLEGLEVKLRYLDPDEGGASNQISEG
jgi:hypothetical protein